MNVIGLLIAAFAVVCYLSVSLPASGRIARGGLVGLRIPSTKRSDAAWLAAHRAALPMTTGVAAITSLLGILIAFEVTPLDLSPEAAALVALAIAVGGLLVATVIADRAARATTTMALEPGAPGAGPDAPEAR